MKVRKEQNLPKTMVVKDTSMKRSCDQKGWCCERTAGKQTMDAHFKLVPSILASGSEPVEKNPSRFFTLVSRAANFSITCEERFWRSAQRSLKMNCPIAAEAEAKPTVNHSILVRIIFLRLKVFRKGWIGG